jgi:hypothetical protein
MDELSSRADEIVTIMLTTCPRGPDMKRPTTVRGDSMITVAKILVPVDFSSGSKIAAEYALALASALRATVTLFHVYGKPDLMNNHRPWCRQCRRRRKGQSIFQELE